MHSSSHHIVASVNSQRDTCPSSCQSGIGPAPSTIRAPSQSRWWKYFRWCFNENRSEVRSKKTVTVYFTRLFKSNTYGGVSPTPMTRYRVMTTSCRLTPSLLSLSSAACINSIDTSSFSASQARTNCRNHLQQQQQQQQQQQSAVFIQNIKAGTQIIFSSFLKTFLPSGLICYLRIENAEGYVLIAVYIFVCVRVIRITQKVLNRIAWNLVGWLVIIRGPFDEILGSIGSRSWKGPNLLFTNLYPIFTNLYPIGMQLNIGMPKFSQFNAQSCDMRRYALYRVPVLVSRVLKLTSEPRDSTLRCDDVSSYTVSPELCDVHSPSLRLKAAAG